MIDDAFMTSPDRGCAPGKATTEMFFATVQPHTSSAEKRVVREARSKARNLCRGHCPFIAQCFTWAEQTSQRNGIWGGVDMAYDRERAQARARFGIATAASAEVPMVDRVLAGTAKDFQELTPEDQEKVVYAGLERGLTLNKMSIRFHCTPRALQLLIGQNSKTFDQQVKDLYDRGKSDTAIALALGAGTNTVARSRARQDLPPLFGPGGRKLTEIGQEQRDKAVRELYEQDLSDAAIARQLDLTPDQVKWIRGSRLDLPAKFTSRGRRIKTSSQDERVSA